MSINYIPNCYGLKYEGPLAYDTQGKRLKGPVVVLVDSVARRNHCVLVLTPSLEAYLTTIPWDRNHSVTDIVGKLLVLEPVPHQSQRGFVPSHRWKIKE